MATLLQFSKNIRRRGRQLENAPSRMVRAVANRTLRSLVRNTRVDTGVARSNWRVGVGAPARSVIKAYTPYKKGSKAEGLGISETANAAATLNAGRARIASLRGLASVGLKTGLFITNNTDHIDVAISQQAVSTASREGLTALIGFKVFTDRT